MTDLIQRLRDWHGFTALVVGDFMLDQLVYGDAERLTADAPVPILHARRIEETPGGAASVCMDLAALHGRVIAFGVIGDDGEGRLLTEKLRASGVDPSGIVVDAARPTTVKRNLIGLAQHRHPQKMFRVDYESRDPLGDDILQRMLEQFEQALREADIVAIEDYAKGVCCDPVCRRIIDLCKAAGVEVLVDPASLDDYSKYRGCTSVTPNRTEAERATKSVLTRDSQEIAPEWMAEQLIAQLESETVVLTLDREGALLLEGSGDPVRIPTVARQVYDVTGAGDMVLAALCAARANDLNWQDAVRFANAAAGLEVEVFGVQPIPFERIYQSLITHGRARHEKLRSLDEAVIEVLAAKRDGKRVVFTNGCFDILHAGHISLLRRAAAFGDMLIIGLNSDDSIRRLKGPDRPVHAERDRIDVLSELTSVDLIVLFATDTPLDLIKALKPDVIVKGADYEKGQVVGGDLVESWGGTIELVPLLDGRSTTGAIEKIRSR